MNEKEKWDAYDRKDRCYDGEFYIAVKTTKIFCRPSCKARTPLRKNIELLDTAQQCVAAGYRACKRCRPDLIEFSPVMNAAEEAKTLIDKHFFEPDVLKKSLTQLSVDRSYLNKLFVAKYERTIAEYIKAVRVRNAKDMIKAGNGIADAAFGSGFGSLSSFYSNFKKEMGTTPGICRK